MGFAYIYLGWVATVALLCSISFPAQHTIALSLNSGSDAAETSGGGSDDGSSTSDPGEGPSSSTHKRERSEGESSDDEKASRSKKRKMLKKKIKKVPEKLKGKKKQAGGWNPDDETVSSRMDEIHLAPYFVLPDGSPETTGSSAPSLPTGASGSSSGMPTQEAAVGRHKHSPSPPTTSQSVIAPPKPPEPTQGAPYFGPSSKKTPLEVSTPLAMPTSPTSISEGASSDSKIDSSSGSDTETSESSDSEGTSQGDASQAPSPQRPGSPSGIQKGLVPDLLLLLAPALPSSR
ncbi:suppressor protein SRP40 [Cyclospora cayetanensis]|uniref:Suppressor protein SRP40 n=1 Tax=Cyclospora cayetanensis TaxID=88456 RepID=A0A6P6RXZ4_9EIME|nr:suppressor protein SRP40 [Cyclospora cayetanensis]